MDGPVISKFKEDICGYDFGNMTDSMDVLVAKYNKCLSDILDNHAPITRRTVIVKPKRPWFDESLQVQQAKTRKLELNGARLIIHLTLLFSNSNESLI